MKRIIAGIICILVIAAVVAMTGTTSSKVALKCSYMGYACGDCHPQFRVDSVLHSDRKPGKIVGADVAIFFEEDGARVPLEEKIDSCWICYDYFVEGSLKEHWLGSKKELTLDKYQLVLRSPDCCPSARARDNK